VSAIVLSPCDDHPLETPDTALLYSEAQAPNVPYGRQCYMQVGKKF